MRRNSLKLFWLHDMQISSNARKKNKLNEMKKRSIILLLIGFILFSCNDLNLNPLSEASSENWYTTVDGVDMGVKYLYSNQYWNTNQKDKTAAVWTDSWTDDWTNRTNVSEVTGGTVNSQDDIVEYEWSTRYECIANANIVLEKLEDSSFDIDETRRNELIALAKFARAYQYSKLIFFYGDVPYYEKVLDIESAFALSRTDKLEILQKIYADYDYAASVLPVSYSSTELRYATKGAVLGFKARIALYMSDWATARDAAKACMDLGEYELLPDFYDVISDKNNAEVVFAVARDLELGYAIKTTRPRQAMTRNSGNTDYVQPSWDLFCAFLCTDGLPIDESPLYNPQKPFDNRDPRCAATIVEFGSRHLGFRYTAHPDSLQAWSYLSNKWVPNRESKAVDQYATFNGLAWRKGIKEENYQHYSTVDDDDVVLRYADILLMYAEAKIELGEINQSVLDALNAVRSRAYNNSGIEYPEITTTNQSELRQIVRLERRMEFAFEARRYYDIIRWKLADKVLNNYPIYGLLDLDELREKVVNAGLWFFPDIPSVDDDGVSDFSAMYNDGLIKLLATRRFDASKQYLWPIPSSEILINKNLVQNPGY